MKKIILAIITCLLTGNFVFAQFIDTSPVRVKAYLDIPFKQIGTIKPKNVTEIESSNWTIGCEVLDRNYARFDAYKEYLPILGVKKIIAIFYCCGGMACDVMERILYLFYVLKLEQVASC